MVVDVQQEFPADVVLELQKRQQLLNEQNLRHDARRKQRVAGWTALGTALTSFIPHHIVVAAGATGVWYDSRGRVAEHDVNIAHLQGEVNMLQAQRLARAGASSTSGSRR